MPGRLGEEQRVKREAAEPKTTVRELGQERLEWLEAIRGAKPSTVRDYGCLLREPGTPFRRGDRTTAGRIMAAFGDRPADAVTTAEVSRLLRGLDRERLTPRNVNKHRPGAGRDAPRSATGSRCAGTSGTSRLS
jgi:hypothetical protein